MIEKMLRRWRAERPYGHYAGRINLSHRRRWFDGDDEETGDNAEESPEDGKRDDTTHGKSDGEKTDDRKPETISLTSAKLKERLERASAQKQREILEALGYESVEDAAVAAEAYRKAEREKLDEETRLKTDLEAAANAKAKAEQERDEAIRSSKLTVARLRITEQAVDALHPEDVIERIFSSQGEDEIIKLVGDKGEIDTQQFAALIKTVREERPHWFNKDNTPGSPSNRDGKPKNPNGKVREEARIRALRRTTNNFG